MVPVLILYYTSPSHIMDIRARSRGLLRQGSWLLDSLWGRGFGGARRSPAPQPPPPQTDCKASSVFAKPCLNLQCYRRLYLAGQPMHIGLRLLSILLLLIFSVIPSFGTALLASSARH